MFIKGFEPDLTGHGGFHFSVGETYFEPGNDDWVWFHYSDTVTECLGNYHDPNARFCEVTPLGKTNKFKCYGHHYWTTNKLRIDRELTKDEITEHLRQEKCPLFILLEYQAPYELLAPAIGKRPSLDSIFRILHNKNLNAEQKRNLLPKKYHEIVEDDANAL